MDEWEQVWEELRRVLSQQPRCEDHPDFPSVRTLRQEVVNDVISVEENGIQVRSHRTGNQDRIPAADFRAWWSQLFDNQSAAINPEDAPRRDRARLVGAIFVRCLPNRVAWDGANQIRLLLTPQQQDWVLPEEVPSEARLLEGATRTISINAYERNPEARRRCIAHYGTNCFVCGFSFRAIYGDVAAELIHVHHERPLSEIGEEYEVDPVQDLKPVCPNCHAVLHRRNPPYSVEEVRAFLRRASGGIVEQ